MASPMIILNEADFRKQLSEAPAGAYLLFGENDYLKNFAVHRARELLGGDPAFACFNEIILDALDFTPEQLRSALMPPPMMAERKVILIRGLNFENMKPSEPDALCDVLAELNEYDYNTVLIPVASGAIDEGYLPKSPSKILKKLAEHLTLVRFERCSPAKLNDWCIRHFKHNDVTATPALCSTLIDSCGRNMFTLANEIDKISYYVLSHGRSEATSADIAAAACTTSEYDAFAFTDALMERNAPRALDILADLKFRHTEPLFVLGEVIRTACDMSAVLTLTRDGVSPPEISKRLGMHEYKVSLYRRHAASAGDAGLRRMIEACRIADRALKLSPRGYDALETLICSL